MRVVQQRYISLVILAALSSCAVATPSRVQSASAIEEPNITHGPFIGHTTSTAVSIWARAATPGLYRLRIREEGQDASLVAEATADVEHDLCVTWTISELQPATRYAYRIEHLDTLVLERDDLLFTTAPGEDVSATVEIAFGSCARENQPTRRTWERLAAADPDAVVLLGDTPYIDSTDLGVQRARYRAFASVEPLRSVLCHTPWYGVWDDHDFGRNDTDGNLPGKDNSRRAFVEYHANPSYGDREHGIYTTFRYGPVQVFLLDTRYFAGTEPSPVSPGRKTLLGAAQWEWLQRELIRSTAPFKILACGMIWNPATRPLKRDHWGAYRYERTALFRFIGENTITGVTLIGGDVHRSRVIRHATADVAGYDIIELITSPMHARVIELANAPHPGLIKDMGEPSSFLMLRADTTQEDAHELTATFISAKKGVLYEYLVTSDGEPGD